VGWGDVDWIGLALDRNRWRARVSWNAGKLSSGLTSSGLSSSTQLQRERKRQSIYISHASQYEEIMRQWSRHYAMSKSCAALRS
jgi:hypothetical protein